MWPGYFAIKRKIRHLTKFRDLIIHRERWAGADADAAPLHELFPELKPGEYPRVEVLEREIKRMQRPIHFDLNFAYVTTGVIHNHREAVTREIVETRYDVILDYFRLPRDGNNHGAYEAVMNTLEEGIGTYQAALMRAKRDMYNPLAWIAQLVRMPITVMERAGFGQHEKTQELMLGGYVRFIKIMMGVVLTFLALILGIKVPWGEIVNGIIQYFLK
jgi:hypothetical protein